MEQPKLDVYLQTARTAACLTQEELGKLLGYKADYIRKVEGGHAQPSVRILLGCFIVFGGSISELFPALVRGIQDEIAAHAAEFDKTLCGKSDPKSRKKLELLASLVPRLTDYPII
jgi:transcriptional regulator with XRE-family HTH domain